MRQPTAIWRALTAALALLALVTAAQPSAPAALAQGGYAESFVLTGLVEKPKTFTQADLMAYPSVTQSVAFGAGQGFQTGRYTGVQLWDLLQEAKVQLDPARNNDRLRRLVSNVVRIEVRDVDSPPRGG